MKALARKPANVFRLLVLLTILFICAQVTFLVLGEFFANLFEITLFTFTTTLFFSYSAMTAFGQFIMAQLFVYAIYIFILWYIVKTISEGLEFPPLAAYTLCLFLYAISVIGLFAWNSLYVPHSVFTKIIRHNLFKDVLSDSVLQIIMYASAGLVLFAVSVAIVFLVSDCLRRQHLGRHAALLALVVSAIASSWYLADPNDYKTTSAATEDKPNIFIIGFDAVRPDFLGYFASENSVATPHFDEFLQSAAIFTRAYTPIARTMPSWGDILTGQYPRHNQIRENNTLLDLVKIKETLPKRMQEAGYTTIYAADDRRFNSIDKRFGFDRLIGPSGTVPDFMIGTLNDFPLSNLISPTRFGKILFPYNYANHGSDFIYNPNNFLSEINSSIQKTPNKPLFLTAHFNLSGWPFIWFNDHVPYNSELLRSYKNSIAGDDRLFANFMTILKDNHLLDHALVFLISDHGITQGLVDDRIVQEANYEGDPKLMKVRRYRYASAEVPTGAVVPLKDDELSLSVTPGSASPFDLRGMGIDTSTGYGGDLLSLKQNLSLFAVKAYGVPYVEAHRVEGRSLLLDIGPTILDILQLAPLEQADGISLKSYLSNPGLKLPERPIYFESAYSIYEMEQRDIVATKVLAQSLKLFYINPHSGAVTIYPPLMKVLLGNKQRAILQGDWLLVYYPQSERFSFMEYKKNGKVDASTLDFTIHSYNKEGEEVMYGIKKHILQPYFVLVNVKTGKWTTSLDNPLTKGSPIAEMKQNLQEFFGDEMATYGDIGLDQG